MTPQTSLVVSACTSARTYTANWSCNTWYEPSWNSCVVSNYTISYDLAWWTASTSNPTSYNIETSTFTLNNPTKAGNRFIGWTGTDLASATMTVTIPQGSTGNRSYTANWFQNNYQNTTTNEYFETLADAIASVPTNNTQTTILVLQDVEDSSISTIASTKNVVLDLQSYTINTTSSSFLINNGTLTVNGTGKIRSTDGYCISSSQNLYINEFIT